MPTSTACHIRLLLISFFLQFFPDLIRNGHLYILDTPLFRVRKQEENDLLLFGVEKQAAIAELGASHEITRFKGLGEISRVSSRISSRKHPARRR